MTQVLRSKEIREGAFCDSAVSIGVFDGVHIGHQKVIEALISARHASGLENSILMTFDRHPLSVTRPEIEPKLLTTLDEKISLLREYDIEAIIIEEFDRELASVDYRSFINERLIRRLGMRHMIIGYDFHLGRNRKGSQMLLCEEGGRLGYNCTVVPPVVIRGIAVSSTRIRRNVAERRLSAAASLLTRPYFFDADVVRGAGIGRTMEFPTANASIAHSEKLLPPHGVYAVRVEVAGDVHDGMMNIGSAPTIHRGKSERIEVHLFDYSGDLYDSRIRIRCLEYLREERQFENRAELQSQLVIDREHVRMILEKNH